MNGNATSQRLDFIDILYTVGIFSVIWGHSHPSDWSLFPPNLINLFYAFHMPLFFFIAGYLFMTSKGIEKDGYFAWIRKKAIRLLTPFFFLSAVCFLPKYYVEFHSFTNLSCSYFLRTIAIPRENIWGHLWYCPVLFLLYLILGAIYSLQKNCIQNKCRIAISLGILLTSCVLFFVPLSTEWLGVNDLCNFSIYFIVGMLIADPILRLSSTSPFPDRFLSVLSVLLLAVGVVLFFSDFYYTKAGKFFTAAIFIFGFLLLSKKRAGSSFCYFFSKNTFTFYLYSWSFQALVELLLKHIEMAWYFTMPLMFAAGVLGPIIILLIYKKAVFLHQKPIKLILGICE